MVSATALAIIALVAYVTLTPGYISTLSELFLLHKTEARRKTFRDVVEAEEKKHPKPQSDLKEWEGFIGFFHPFCHAAGGGEKVLWAAIKATQNRYPKAICIVYTGGVNFGGASTDTKPEDAARVMGEAILDRAEKNFNVRLSRPRIVFQILSSRDWLLASRYPHFTLLGQSLGSLRVAYDALSEFVPDVFIDTMGYSFVTALAAFLVPTLSIGAYVHYPTISIDMLGSLDVESDKGLNAGTGKGLKGSLKRIYWHIFARLYGWTGRIPDIVMTNSSWTQGHIESLWGPGRSANKKTLAIEVVFPPVSVEEIEAAIDVSETSEAKREDIIIYIAQFRAEKNHELVIEAFSEFIKDAGNDSGRPASTATLVLLGSVRDDDDGDMKSLEHLRALVEELHISSRVNFVCNAPWNQMLDWLSKSSIGVNGMWNEHFGIGVVEYQAAGLICVVNDSGGPKRDIVVDFDGGPTGFHASTISEYAAAFSKAFALSREETLKMRLRARSSAKRFSEKAFTIRWVGQLDKLIDIQTSRQLESA